VPANPKTRSKALRLVPYGLLATKAWLMKQGLPRHAIDNLVKSHQLKKTARGVLARPDTPLKWQGVVCSLQRMGSDVTVGGLSALQLHGFAHYLPLSDRTPVHLYGRDPLPPWANRLGLSAPFVWHSTKRLFTAHTTQTPSNTFTQDLPWGDQSWTLRVATPERALLEVLDEVPSKISFEHADQLMQGLTTLSPRRLEGLLRLTRNVKVKRLFFWLAERQGHAWFKKLTPSEFDLGSGKRVLAKGGKYVPKYRITVPEEMYG
jgi:Transcriptional regulator, AbiEi antitoxin, Type IV TA system/Transcriptional regulator, AbiEi antitoxin N-terminal domain